jgi:hypothetical protein
MTCAGIPRSRPGHTPRVARMAQGWCERGQEAEKQRCREARRGMPLACAMRFVAIAMPSFRPSSVPACGGRARSGLYVNVARRAKDFIWTKVQEKDRVHLREWIRCDGLALRHRQFQVEQGRKDVPDPDLELSAGFLLSHRLDGGDSSVSGGFSGRRIRSAIKKASYDLLRGIWGQIAGLTASSCLPQIFKLFGKQGRRCVSIFG